MVKGVTRRVVIVKSPDRELFDEAYFIVREGAPEGVTAEDLIAEARRITSTSLSARLPARLRGGPGPGPVLFSLLGGGLVGLIWAICAFLV